MSKPRSQSAAGRQPVNPAQIDQLADQLADQIADKPYGQKKLNRLIIKNQLSQNKKHRPSVLVCHHE